MVRDDAVNDGEAEARSAAEGAVKWLEQSVELIGLDPHALVCHFERHCRGPLALLGPRAPAPAARNGADGYSDESLAGLEDLDP